MKSFHKELWFEIPSRMDFINITRDVEEAVAISGIQEGLCLVNAMHITASVFINDDEPGLHRDYKKWLEDLAPHAPLSRYDHNLTGEDNGDAHHKRQIMGREVVVAVTEGRLHFGTWEQIFYGEFDGRRRKRVLVKIIGE
ncbi:MAG TPA: secondary thiamine-phosphate synthase enzyme [Candidatus Marinimicrobia bacterium]|nr:secondary thiamine-phosphate synthase enzyme [Candidatus Neomarinimicrobiota bacterium]